MRSKGLSPYISSTLVLVIGLVAVYLVLTIVKPTLNKAQDTAVITEAFQNLELIDNYIREVVSEGEDSKRTIPLKVTDGTYSVDSNCGCINFSYRLKSEFNIGGSKDNINITKNMNNLNLFIAYDRIQIQGTDRFPKGDNSVVIMNNGINSSTNYSMVYVGK